MRNPFSLLAYFYSIVSTMNETLPWDVLLIGGHSTSGKSSVACELGRRLGIPVSQVDDYRLILQRATQPGQIAGLHFFLQPDVIWQAPPDQLVSQLVRIGEIMSHALEAVIAHHVLVHTPIILEGDGILPQLAVQALCDGVTVAERVRAVFIVEPDEERFAHTCRARWPDGGDDPEAVRWRRLAWAYGQWLQSEARALGLPVIHSQPWETLARRVDITI